LLVSINPVNWISGAWYKISDWFANLWGKVTNVFTSAWDGIKVLFVSINPVNWISGAWDKVTEYFVTLKTRFFEFGDNIIKGLIAGIQKNIGKLFEKVKDVGKQISKTFTSLLGIHSPSRIFLDYGVNITKGLTVGIDYGIPTVGNTMKDLAVTASEKFSFESMVKPIVQPIFEPIFENIFKPIFETPKTESPVMQMITNSGQTIESNSVPVSQFYNSNQGGSTITFSPVVNITGNPASEETKQDFLKILRSYSKEIVDIINRDRQNKIRLSFND
jgi:phage-related protein